MRSLFWLQAKRSHENRLAIARGFLNHKKQAIFRHQNLVGDANYGLVLLSRVVADFDCKVPIGAIKKNRLTRRRANRNSKL